MSKPNTPDITVIRARIKELRQQRDALRQQLEPIEEQLATQEHLNRIYAPLGYYLLMRDGKEIECEAQILDQDGEDLSIAYRLPPFLAETWNREDQYLKWLRTPEERTKFSTTRLGRKHTTLNTYTLMIIPLDRSKATPLRSCLSDRIEEAQLEAIQAFHSLSINQQNTHEIRLMNDLTRVLEFRVSKDMFEEK